jgi:hypothetical protein
VVFGDVHAYCNQLALLLSKDAHTIVCAEADALTHLGVMAHMQHAVVPNSTFHWWGTWLADQRYKGTTRHVVCPDPWVLLTGSPCPERWTRIPARLTSDDPTLRAAQGR